MHSHCLFHLIPPTPVDALKCNYEKAVTWIEGKISAYNDRRAQGLLERAKEAKRRGLSNKAERMFDRVIDYHVKGGEVGIAAAVAEEAGMEQKAKLLHYQESEDSESMGRACSSPDMMASAAADAKNAGATERADRLYKEAAVMYAKRGRFDLAALTAQRMGDSELATRIYNSFVKPVNPDSAPVLTEYEKEFIGLLERLEMFGDAAERSLSLGLIERAIGNCVRAGWHDLAIAMALKHGMPELAYELDERANKRPMTLENGRLFVDIHGLDPENAVITSEMVPDYAKPSEKLFDPSGST